MKQCQRKNKNKFKTISDKRVRVVTHNYATRFRNRFAQVSGVAHKHNQWLVSCKNTRKGARCHPPSCLPNDVIRNILLRLPVQVLYDQVRYVCKGWHNIISDPTFINAHFQMSSPGILFHDRAQPSLLHHLQKNGNELKLTELSIPFAGKIVSSCHGLVMIHDWANSQHYYHVLNPITKVTVSLPPISGEEPECTGFRAALSFTSSGQYKAAHVYFDFDVPGVGDRVHAVVCTVGVDKAWRNIDLEGISMCGCQPYSVFLCQLPRAIGGLTYWFDCRTSFGLALDFDTEVFYEIPSLESNGFTPKGGESIYLDTGLGYVDRIHEKPGLWMIWELTDAKIGKWTKVCDIDGADFYDKCKRMFYPRVCKISMPVVYKKNGDFWLQLFVHYFGAVLVCYNMTKGTLLLSPTGIFHKHYLRIYPHVNTLLPLKNG